MSIRAKTRANLFGTKLLLKITLQNKVYCTVNILNILWYNERFKISCCFAMQFDYIIIHNAQITLCCDSQSQTCLWLCLRSSQYVIIKSHGWKWSLLFLQLNGAFEYVDSDWNCVTFTIQNKTKDSFFGRFCICLLYSLCLLSCVSVL